MSIQQNKFTEIANSIRTKKGTFDPIIANDFASEILSIPTGGGIVEKKDITFYDYDGTILYTYTIDEFMVMSELPSPPSHDRLVFQEWNWSLADIKAVGGTVDVGATYTTASGKSEFDLTFNVVTGLAVTMRMFNIVVGNIITVDWGDGTSDNTTTSVGQKTISHTYESYGDYTVTVDSTGTYYFYAGAGFSMFGIPTSYNCTAARLGDRCTRLYEYTFQSCRSLQSITIPNNIISIERSTFQNCHILPSIIIPNGITSINTYVFTPCYALQSIIMPNSITSIGQSAFYTCYALQSITIPNGITNIEQAAFHTCFGVQKYIMKSVAPPSLANINVFEGISQLCIIEVPKGSLQAYRTATNWVTYANHMREAEQ